MGFVPDDFDPPDELVAAAFRLEPLGPEHNERDHDAWMSSIDHIRATPGFPNGDWPTEMTLEPNLADLEQHARDFDQRVGFTYSVLDGDDVIGSVYVYPSEEGGNDAVVSSWVTANRADLDRPLWQTVSTWLADRWPFDAPFYAER